MHIPRWIFLIVLLYEIIQLNGQRPLVNVNTSRGPLIGYHFDQGSNTSAFFYGQADIFEGIPFAKPPVGSLRFSKPQRLAKFPESPYNATYFRSECIQGSQQTSAMSEDCLYLNIWTPNASATNKYPVMVWIHGGGLQGGNGGFGPNGIVRNLISRGVVLASIQYRLGFLGFFTTFTDDFPPNLGLLDQVEALKFIQEEISNFGGDPNKVTIFGQSAGSASVSLHTYSPLSQNLFQQSIQESGAMLTCYEDAVGPTNRLIEFAKHACGFSVSQWNTFHYEPLKNCLMNISINDGLKAQGESYTGNEVCWNMVQDDNFFPGVPADLYKKRINKPVMIGTMKDEWAFTELIYDLKPNYTQLTTYTRQWVENHLKNLFPTYFQNKSLEVLAALENIYLANQIADDDHLAWLQFMVDIGTSLFFTSTSALDIQYHLLNKNPNVYAWEFTWSSVIEGANNVFQVPGWHPVPHTAELVYLFYYADWEGDLKKGVINETDLALADFFGEAWTNFVKYGKPTMDDSWKVTTSTDPTNMEYFEIGANSGMRTGYRKNDQISWNQVLPKILGTYPQNKPDFNNGSLIGCPTSWTKSTVNTKQCYGIFSDAQTEYSAINYCAKNLATLASVENAFQNNELQKFINANSPSCTKSYIGLVKNGQHWTWNNGDPSTYLNWESGYPSSSSDANCVVINSNGGKWSNQNCGMPQCYICSFELQ